MEQRCCNVGIDRLGRGKGRLVPPNTGVDWRGRERSLHAWADSQATTRSALSQLECNHEDSLGGEGQDLGPRHDGRFDFAVLRFDWANGKGCAEQVRVRCMASNNADRWCARK